MLIVKILLLILVIGGIFLFARGLNIKNNVSIFFGLLFILTPMVWLTLGTIYLPFAPVIVLVIIYVFQQLDKKES